MYSKTGFVYQFFSLCFARFCWLKNMCTIHIKLRCGLTWVAHLFQYWSSTQLCQDLFTKQCITLKNWTQCKKLSCLTPNTKFILLNKCKQWKQNNNKSWSRGSSEYCWSPVNDFGLGHCGKPIQDIPSQRWELTLEQHIKSPLGRTVLVQKQTCPVSPAPAWSQHCQEAAVLLWWGTIETCRTHSAACTPAMGTEISHSTTPHIQLCTSLIPRFSCWNLALVSDLKNVPNKLQSTSSRSDKY